MGSTKRARDNGRLPWSGAPDCPVCHQTVSGAPGNSTPNSSPSGIFRGLHYNSPEYHRTVSGAPEESDSELTSFGNLLRYNSPDMSGAHRTIRWASGATATSRQRSTAGALNARQRAQKSEHARVAHRTVYRTCPVHHRTIRRAHKSELQRSEPNGLVTWLAHRTVWCAMRQQPPPNG
jgi:hypothetical protein